MAHCHKGIAATIIRDDMSSGLKKGTSDSTIAMGVFGFPMIPCAAMNGRMIRINTGHMTCCASCSLLIVAPAAANSPEYNR